MNTPWPRDREVEKPKPTPVDLMGLLDSMDAWLRNDTPIQGLTLEDVIAWRETLAQTLGVPPESWFSRRAITATADRTAR